jgi:hypothetical protein
MDNYAIREKFSRVHHWLLNPARSLPFDSVRPPLSVDLMERLALIRMGATPGHDSVKLTVVLSRFDPILYSARKCAR